MSDAASKDPHFKGQSRVLKVCHWCAKKQEPGQKPFQACGRCKEVIYCSKECQVASWPLHKVPCKMNASNGLAQNPEIAASVATFKKWHSQHLSALQQAIICALDLGNNPKALDDNMLFVDVSLKPNHAELPIKRKYTILGGFTVTMAEAREMLGPMGGDALLDSCKEASDHMKAKGAIGMGLILLKAHGMVDLVRVIMPSAAGAKTSQNGDDWGREEWPNALRFAVEID
ncbi:hypothetical protein D9619_001799 [Psilocybe cf. subviscida]|uniref:MYND-type domain-containing protein n=1 Tax=Psilocybe cf. subviscida TaxID=2480587 RepID=A0A8H5BG13_9AGAR|nr:hypothetical protein D9619_001799 [Psilocybe cf. subviscida]